MKQNKFFWIVIILLATVTLAACGGTEAEPEAAAEVAVVEASEPPAEPTELVAEEPMAPEPSPTPVPPTPEPTEELEPTAEPELTVEPTPALLYFNRLPVELPGTDEVRIENVAFSEYQGQPLTMDIYYPPDMAEDALLPVVIFVAGFPDDSKSLQSDGVPLKDLGQILSWGRLTAASGLIAVAYQTMEPNDLASVVAYLQEHGSSMNMDAERIGLWAAFSNVPSAISYAMQEERDFVKFVVNYYGAMLTPDNEFREMTDAVCENMDCYGAELADIPALRSDLPLFIAKVGRPRDSSVNPSIDHFMTLATAEGVPVTLMEIPKGHPGFDLWDHELEETIPTIEETLKFMQASFETNAS
jgi:acetyl esterase/lipase